MIFTKECYPRRALDKASIAEMSSTVIDRMTCEELVQLIKSAELSAWHRQPPSGNVALYDRDTLVRLAHLARRCCQNQLLESVA